jgi:NADP-dependent aldehyde dehydrogenase
MELSGQSFLGRDRGALTGTPFQATNPATGEAFGPTYYSASTAEVDKAVELASSAFAIFSGTSGKARGALLRRMADNLDQLRDPIAERAHLETALPMPRLFGEIARTTNQLRMFASEVEEGSWVQARIDSPLPDRQPLPRPSLRSMLRPLGPVAVFGASNFPVAFSTAGGDTASALAAGCPVIFKAHSAHPGTSELVASALQQAIADEGLPEGIFSQLYDAGVEIGAALVRHPHIEAVSFTGSLRGGRALMDMAAARPRPIPCFTEMASLNPVFVLPGALANPDSLARGLFNSFTLGAGQMCTKPGLVFVPQGPQTDAFVDALIALVNEAQPYTLLTPDIARSYARFSSARAGQVTLSAEAKATARVPGCTANAQFFTTTFDEFPGNPALSQEIFGPTTLLIRCQTQADFLRAAATLEGHLTATIAGTEQEVAAQPELIRILAGKVGRLLFNGFPTGVEVSHAMVHGGPYPATSDARFTSVGSQAIFRFARPVCFQSFPDALMPAELQAANPLGILRLIDGVPSRNPIV